jgi:hypothetical protein
LESRRRHDSDPNAQGRAENYSNWAIHEFFDLNENLPGSAAAAQILLPLAAVAFGMTIFGLVYFFSVPLRAHQRRQLLQRVNLRHAQHRWRPQFAARPPILSTLRDVRDEVRSPRRSRRRSGDARHEFQSEQEDFGQHGELTLQRQQQCHRRLNEAVLTRLGSR